MRSFLIILILHSILVTCAQLPVLQWADSFKSNSAGLGTAIATDASGNVYTAGYVIGVTDFDPGPGTYTGGLGNLQMFISKLDASGNFVWANTIPVVCFEPHVALDASGNVYITGYFAGSVDFDPGASLFNLTSAGVRDVFVLKMDPQGNFMWAVNMGGSSTDQGVKSVLDASGNIYTTGFFSGTGDFDPGPAVFNLTSQGFSDVFVLKLDAAGNLIWAKSFGGSSWEESGGSVLDAQANVYVTGQYNGICDFDPGSGVFNMTALGGCDVFVTKLDASGNFIWAKSLGGSGSTDEDGNSICTDASGNLCVTGNFKGTGDFDPGSPVFNLASAGDHDGFIVRLDLQGNFLWAGRIGGVNYDLPFSIAADPFGNVYLGGFFRSTADFDPGTGSVNLTSFGNYDAFMLKLDVGGNFVWAIQLGDTATDVGRAVCCSSAGNIYQTGYFSGAADFDPGPGTSIISTPSYNVFNPYVCKFAEIAVGVTYSPNMHKTQMFPNPTDGVLTLDVGRSKIRQAEVYSLTGELLDIQKFDTARQQLNLSRYPSGTYLVKVSSDKGWIWTQKVIKR